MNLGYVLTSVGVMAFTTYLIRVLPMVLLRKKITNPFLFSFLGYVPYAVLAAMTIPAIFSSTTSLPSAIVGFAAALVVSYLGAGLMPVALCACGAVLATEFVMKFI